MDQILLSNQDNNILKLNITLNINLQPSHVINQDPNNSMMLMMKSMMENVEKKEENFQK